MARKSRRKIEVLPESPASLDTVQFKHVRSTPMIEISENNVENPTLTEAKVEEDPRYLVLKAAVKQITDSAPAFDKGKDNPWLYLEVINQLKRLVQ